MTEPQFAPSKYREDSKNEYIRIEGPQSSYRSALTSIPSKEE